VVRRQELDAWARARAVADKVLERGVRDRTGGALFFHTTAMRNPWRIPRERTARIGRHVFYR
jgi:N-acetylmuramoyl-L-alanine amidase